MHRNYFACCRARCLALILAAALVPTALSAQTRQVPTFTAGKLDPSAEGPTIDGRVNDAAWQGVQPYTNFTQQDPNEGEPASEKTEVRILVGKGILYVGIIAFDSDPSKIIVSQARRDASLNDTDSVVMVFDTFNDTQNAFVFGTNPLGIEYDGQVAREGQTSGVSVGGGGGGNSSGTARGGISAFNPNWDGDWTVKSQITERGWEAELAIPLKTLRYQTGENQTWGFNLLRNIRHKNEQVYLAPIPRGFDIYRVSLAAKMTGLDLPTRRDIKIIPYALGSTEQGLCRSPARTSTKNADFGVDLKWGIRPNLTLDATYNTDFAQVEADEEQVNLTRFDLFFPEKRPFFLENASTFQFGNPQQIDLFFSRRIGLSPSALPIDIRGGGRLSGKVAGWNVGVLNIQADDVENIGGDIIGPANNFSVVRLQREVGRSSYGAIFVSRQGFGEAKIQDDWNRAYGFDLNYQVTTNQRLSAFIARTDTPTTRTSGPRGSDYSGRAFYNFTNQSVAGLERLFAGGRELQSRSGLPAAPRLSPSGVPRVLPAAAEDAGRGFADSRRTSATRRSMASTISCRARMYHIHPFEIQPRQGGRFGWFFDYLQDVPTAPFTVFNRDGQRVVIPAGTYGWGQHGFEYTAQPRLASDRLDPGTHRRLLRRRLQELRAYQRLPHHAEGDRERRLDAAGHRFAGRQLRQQPGADQGQPVVHDVHQLVGVAAVQRAGRAVLVERALRVAESQRHGPVRRL